MSDESPIQNEIKISIETGLVRSPSNVASSGSAPLNPSVPALPAPGNSTQNSTKETSSLSNRPPAKKSEFPDVARKMAVSGQAGESPTALAKIVHIPEVQKKPLPSRSETGKKTIYVEPESVHVVDRPYGSSPRRSPRIEAPPRGSSNPPTNTPVPNQNGPSLDAGYDTWRDQEYPWRQMWPGVSDTVGRRYWRHRQRVINNSMNLITRSRERAERRQAQADHSVRNIPSSFRPNVKQPENRRKQWKEYQAGKRRQEKDQERASKDAQRSSEKRQKEVAAQRRLRRRRISAQVGRYRAFGRSTGASVGAMFGARVAGPWGAAAGSHLGGELGGQLAGNVGRMVAAGRMGAAVAAAAPVAAVAGIALAYDMTHKAMNSAIRDGVIPFTEKLLKAVPVLSNFVGTMEAINHRFQRDKERYGAISPGVTSAEAIGEARMALARIQNVNQRSMASGKTLDQLMGEREGLNKRWQVAQERLEAAGSRFLYNRFNPILERLVKAVELLVPVIERLLAFFDMGANGFNPVMKEFIKHLLAFLLPGIGIPLIFFDKIIDYIDRKNREDAAKRAEAMKDLGEDFFRNIDLLMFGPKQPLNQKQKQAVGDLAGR